MRGERLLCVLVLVSTSSFGSGQRSKAECEEYAKSVYVEEDSPVLSRRSAKHKVSQCAIEATPLVIGGVEAHPKEFPHMAVIGYAEEPNAKKFEWKCGGTLISHKFVLTAGHCITTHESKPQIVRLGEVDFKTTEESETQDRKIDEIITHPDYKRNSKYNDIALLKLDSAVKFNAYVRPACLNMRAHLTEKTAIATGFGKTSFDAMEGSEKLMKVTLTFMNNKECTKYFKNEVITGSLSDGVTDSMLCAGELGGGKDTCQGDSGGPLQIVLDKPYCMYSIVGVISFGKFCGFANQPAIYTNISHYIEWIEKIVWL